ncbi:hypothetical protein ACGFNY_20305 [Streptomyces chartreusis]|uniref:hypothetical protein n=1 Tax=Streptomyces chartreusis TaxID=1969 RepID=UPI0037182DB8
MIAAGYFGSNDFWNTLVSALLGIAVGVASVLATLKAQNPKRRIVWEVHSNQSLVPTTTSGAPSVTISHVHSTGPLTEARLVELKLRNAGRKDVIPGDFTLGNESLVFDFGVPVAALLDVATDPPSAPQPNIIISGNELKVASSPILRGQELSYSVLINGPEKKVKIKTAAILNTPPREGNPARRELLKYTIPAVIAAVAGLLATLVLDSQREKAEDDRYNHIRACRYWDANEPTRAQADCPPIMNPKNQ